MYIFFKISDDIKTLNIDPRLQSFLLSFCVDLLILRCTGINFGGGGGIINNGGGAHFALIEQFRRRKVNISFMTASYF
jgi:hypothetical protein